MAFTERRMDESRRKLAGAYAFALGSYMEQEAKKEDQWREQNTGQLYAHLAHEITEIQGNLRQGDKTWLLHNAADAAGLALIFLAHVLDMQELAAHSRVDRSMEEKA